MVAYSPPVKDVSELAVVKQTKADAPGLIPCWEQMEPARKLVNFKDIPTMLLVSEASFHAGFDHCTVKWARQAGVKTDFIRLEERGIHGNGHMMMIEKNNLQIAKLIDDWVVENVKPSQSSSAETTEATR